VQQRANLAHVDATMRLFKASERGTGQGSVISPLLANIYLHYAFDLWANRWRQREATGDMIILRYADDSVPRRH
jgi:retron-type reverse transcriptase